MKMSKIFGILSIFNPFGHKKNTLGGHNFTITKRLLPRIIRAIHIFWNLTFKSVFCTFAPLGVNPQNKEDMEEVKTTELLRTTQSWDGAQIPPFPRENAEIISIRYEFPPGKKLGWHHHNVINFGYVQQGELTIIDIHGNAKVVHQGEALVEMVGTIHHGENNGSEKVILVMFYVAEKGTPISVQRPDIPLY